METRAEIAVNKRAQGGMNCAQAVATTYADLAGKSETELSVMTQALGTGIGASMEGTCGALTGAAVVLGLRAGEGNRPQAMKEAREMMAEFKSQNGSVTCKELKGVETGCILRSCEDCIRDVCHYIERSM